MTKGIFLLSFMDLSTSAPIAPKDLKSLYDKLKPIIKKVDCDLIITNKPCLPIGRGNFKRYLGGLLKQIEKFEKCEVKKNAKSR